MSGKPILITGGAGFIGSNLIRQLIDDYRIICLDRLSYAGNPRNLSDLTDTIYLAPGYPPPKRDGGMGIKPLKEIPDDRLVFILGAVNDFDLLHQILKKVSGIIHLAAETHVDRSLLDPGPFLRSDLLGTYILLEAIRREGRIPLLHVSTDEIYGSRKEGRCSEDDPLNPTNPYAVAKAAADRLVLTYHKSFGLPVMVVRPSNNYGPYQHIEKFIPFMIVAAHKGLPLYLYGDGSNIRSWIHVEDCCRAIRLIFENWRDGEIYNISGEEITNLRVAQLICRILGIDPDRIEFIGDRPAHDYRYALNDEKLRNDLGFNRRIRFSDGLTQTIHWYREHVDWWQELWDEEFEAYLSEWYGRLGARPFKKP